MNEAHPTCMAADLQDPATAVLGPGVAAGGFYCVGVVSSVSTCVPRQPTRIGQELPTGHPKTWTGGARWARKGICNARALPGGEPRPLSCFPVPIMPLEVGCAVACEAPRLKSFLPVSELDRVQLGWLEYGTIPRAQDK